jgi:hypothetical protein
LALAKHEPGRLLKEQPSSGAPDRAIGSYRRPTPTQSTQVKHSGSDEIDRMVASYEAGKMVESIAEALDRSPSGIRYRLSRRIKEFKKSRIQFRSATASGCLV